MGIKVFLSVILFFVSTSLLCQLSLKVRELNYDEFKEYVPDNDFLKNMESKYRGHIFEISLINDSEKSISFPLDTLSYALPYSENRRDYYRNNDFPKEPDLFNVLAVYPFVYQKNKFVTNGFDLAYDPIDILPRSDQKAKDELKNYRSNKIKGWKEKNKFNSDLQSVYNWYILNNMITIAPKSEIKYKIYFNPFLKRQDLFDYHEFYWPLDSSINYQVAFKIILNKKLYQFLTEENKKKFPNLFTGVVTSETLDMSTNTIK